MMCPVSSWITPDELKHVLRLQEAGIPRIVAAGVPTFPCIPRRDGVLASADAHLVHGLLCDSLAHGMYNDKSKKHSIPLV